MMKMCCYVLIIVLVIFFVGCVGLWEQFVLVEEVKLQLQQFVQLQFMVLIVLVVFFVLVQSGLIEYQDQQLGQLVLCVCYYDWNGVVQLLVGQMLQVSGVNVGSILLVDSVNNCINGLLNVGEVIIVLCSVLVGNGKFILVLVQQLVVVKQQLGLLLQDSFGSCSKVMGIVCNVGVQYVFYFNVIGNVNVFELKMQFMLV